ncbi:MAG: nicotinate-nucleotide adenylyltransferase [Rhodospirillales bacterium]
MAARRIGLLGGSFDPAHAGHRYISLAALGRLRLDEVWWLVSPQNPLKTATASALEDRLETARRVAAHPSIRVTDIERTLGTVYTVDTLRALVRRCPAVRFVWLIGADNLVQIPRWRRWRKIFTSVPIAVFARPPYSFKALTGRAARRFASARIAEARSAALAEMRPPAWVFLHTRPHPESATRIRAARNPKQGRRAGTGKP